MRKIIIGSIIVILLMFLLPWNRINWGKVSMAPAAMVTVTGEAHSIEKNQIATFNAGVDAVRDKKEEAVKEVNDKVGAIIEAVKNFGIPGDDIQTQNLSIYQDEEMYWEGGVQKTRKGQWRVSNSVSITLRDLNKASDLANLITESGANNVYGPNFQFDDTSEAGKSLFDSAMKDAREKAEIVAKSSGRKLGKVLTVVEGGANSPLPYLSRDGMGGGSNVPMEPGSGTVSKSVTVSFELN